ncbi:MAG: diaminopimelate decarboxylase [Candidatus Micrarchaeota archaeon]
MVDFYKTGIVNRNGNLFIGSVSAALLAKKFRTPLYVINENRIRENYIRLRNALAKKYKINKVRIHYAMKANSNLNILKILNSEGSYIDALSLNEVLAALDAGFAKEKILFTGTNVTDDELRALSEKKIRMNLDSRSALERLIKIVKSKFISARINPEIGAGHHSHTITAGPDSKFGIWEHDALEFYERAKSIGGVKKFGIHMHIGSGILNVVDFIQPLARFMDIAGKIAKKTGIKFEFIDIGGGLGVPYKPEDEFDLDKYVNEVLGLFVRKLKEHKLGEPYFCIEPGRFLVADAVVLLTRVNTLKQTPHKKFAGIDAGFNVLVRPTMYDSYHHIIVDGKPETKNKKQETYDVYDVVGPICESGDYIARARTLPKLSEGDLLCVLTTGAYGYSMSSNYNLRTRAAEILVNNGKYELVRKHDEFEKIISGQRKASWLYRSTKKTWIAYTQPIEIKPKKQNRKNLVG